MRFGADDWGDIHANHKFAASDRGVVESAQNIIKLTTLILAIYIDILLLVMVVILIVVVKSLSRTAVGAT